MSVGLEILHHRQQGRGWLETSVRTGAGTGGALAAGGAAAKLAAPMLAGGPVGWLGYGGTVAGATALGGMGASAAAGGLFEEDPGANLWVEGFGREGLPAPGPPGQLD